MRMRCHSGSITDLGGEGFGPIDLGGEGLGPIDLGREVFESWYRAACRVMMPSLLLLQPVLQLLQPLKLLTLVVIIINRSSPHIFCALYCSW